VTRLVVSATDAEIAPLLASLGTPLDLFPRVRRFHPGGGTIDVLITGVGMVATAAWCSRVLATTRYDQAFDFGVCGSFSAASPPGTVVHVIEDTMPEVGAEDGESFLTVHDMRLLDADEFPFHGGSLVSTPPANAALSRLPQVRGITVNTVHGDPRSIARVVERWQPDVESMEGAAFVYSCLVQGVPCAQVRAVSNVVERRNRAAWKLADAIGALNRAAVEILESS
jgi:futalosine hydrolase